MAVAKTKKSAPASKPAAAKPEPADEVVTSSADTADEVTKIVPKEIDANQYITVRNGFHGRLVYVSSRTGETFIWDEFGGEQEIELRELRNVKNSAKRFFTDNWFMFNEEDDWVLDYLGVRQYYKNALNVDVMDEIFDLSPSEILKRVPQLSEGQKRSLSYEARVRIANEDVDSIKVIRALETALGTELIER